MGYLAPGTAEFVVFLVATITVSVRVCLLVALVKNLFSINRVQYHRLRMTVYAFKNIFVKLI
jgi:hypothetical protein